ncbi:hypothetical protein LOZ53_003771 [Ophidiomyces ophidiicola]|uniref:Uncharacterized protein n=1 Tax=Ophidiomyces ophidiicola TaxID=1387563 RepID=A0ACB8UV63_9EURO|nr:uncharacterized protein LOZ57_003987 [Ophidiomyces ophidiicola]KAI1945736.1 hypothetical protein LOZ57_003987 [Ophidiomyces ophidiicola]KAI1950654.1 hypothetical protein LOZ62_001919 [Ophidiomyces ophidiicola]KAI1970230.1 hypothetical protein LOZ55_006590 [Ophidiomyces ophidiicola]KAI1972617.1 hypothetical protein LOZ56_002327 [Ophidiomyces ophidiicola]KAI1988281.1 hypothetical protein LOZ54_003263 [Ophidiomyces ophidiicola]
MGVDGVTPEEGYGDEGSSQRFGIARRSESDAPAIPPCLDSRQQHIRKLTAQGGVRRTPLTLIWQPEGATMNHCQEPPTNGSHHADAADNHSAQNNRVQQSTISNPNGQV